jgi:hypothetical protein
MTRSLSPAQTKTLSGSERAFAQLEKSEHWFSKIATETASLSGRPWTFGMAGGFVVVWLGLGPDGCEKGSAPRNIDGERGRDICEQRKR